MEKKNCEKFWIYIIPLLLQTETSYESKLFAVAKFVKRNICSCEIHLTWTQLALDSGFIPDNVIGTGYSSSAYESISDCILIAWYASWEDAGHTSLHRHCIFSKSARFCKATNAIILLLAHDDSLWCSCLVRCFNPLAAYSCHRLKHLKSCQG